MLMHRLTECVCVGMGVERRCLLRFRTEERGEMLVGGKNELRFDAG